MVNASLNPQDPVLAMYRKVLLSVLGLVVIAAFLFWLTLSDAPSSPSSRLVHENYRLIREGMSLAEVEMLLGGPPGNYGQYSGDGKFMTLDRYLPPRGSIRLIWCDDSNRFEIYFDGDGCVVGQHRREYYSQTPCEEGFFAELRRMVGL